MSLILVITAGGALLYLLQSQEKTVEKKWLIVNFFAFMIWQLSDMYRLSLHPSFIGTKEYKIIIIYLFAPSLILLEIGFIQFAYYFIHHVFDRERKIVLWMTIGVSPILIGLIHLNEFYSDYSTDVSIQIIGSYTFLTNFWAMLIYIRKARLSLPNNQSSSTAYIGLALVSAGFIITSIVAIVFGLYSYIGFWAYFIGVWVGNITQFFIYMSFAPVSTSYQIRLVGFTLVTMLTILSAVALAFFPPALFYDIDLRNEQQEGLYKLFLIIIFATLFILLIFPIIVRFSLIQPLKSLLKAVKRVDEGNLATQVIINNRDEIGILSTSFNRMTQSLKRAHEELKSYADTLEAKVTERTAKVEAQKKEIEVQRDSLEAALIKLKEAQRQLIQKEKMASLGEVTAGIAHEIQNPLNFVNNFSEVSEELVEELEQEAFANRKEGVLAIAANLKQNLQKIHLHGQRADGIVRGMLQHARTFTGEKQLTDINALIDEYLRLAYYGIQTQNKSFSCTLKTSFDQDLGKVKVVPQELGKVLLNLFHNAFYAVQQRQKNTLVQFSVDTKVYNPTVSVSTRQFESQVKIRVRDNGIGMPESVKSKVFQPFFSTKPPGQGTGLGLSLSYDIITRGHSGEMCVTSEENEWTEFTVSLPHMPVTEEQPAASTVHQPEDTLPQPSNPRGYGSIIHSFDIQEKPLS
ncbi:ATP-binding protein [Pontibacter sp. E15-1]|uniref:sensor histidine kinase n=1 Tax=Pontibacter sp. E15-1 TaxID=2919918 RepID=UPI001F4F5BBE|nr:HAMP domain-containing sensor histidine kinase [Pontibacter sp. E15-1]MCJ8165012.1 ATP-binding protein [Pontibacter sp. E15-1]